MGLREKHGKQCREFAERLEDAAADAPGAADIEELLGSAPELRDHASSCSRCRAAAEDILASRALLAALPSKAAQLGPWFAPRVMAAIAARTAELTGSADAWTFLPKLAARLTWASSIALLLASGWLYQRPASNPPKAVVTDITGEPIVDNVAPAADDELFLSLAEREKAPR